MSSKDQSRIKELEEELSKTKYNKRTQHHVGLVKAKLAKLKEKEETKRSKTVKGDGYSVRKTGDATVVMVGFPSVGKSTLLNALTNAESKTAAYAFTTLSVIPGMLNYKKSKIQILDVPGIVRGAAAGTGRGKEVLSVIWSSDMIMFVLDINELKHLPTLKKEVYDFNIRIDKKKPDVRIRKTAKGGIQIASTKRLSINKETIKGILNEFKIMNASILIRSKIDEDQLIDCIQSNKKYLPSLLVINKIDTVSDEQLTEIRSKYPNAVFVSGATDMNLDKLKDKIFKHLSFIRIYLKEPGKEADTKDPLIMFEGSTLKDICMKLHKDFIEKFKFARIWGNSAKYEGQMKTKLDHQVSDEDIIELHIR